MRPMKTSRSRKGRESRRKRIHGSGIRSGGERLSLPKSGPRPRRVHRCRFGRLEPAGVRAKPGSVRVSGEEPGRGSALGELPEIQVFKDVFDDTRLFDHRDNLESVTALGTRQRVNLVHLPQQPRPVAPALPGERLGGRVLLGVFRRGEAVGGLLDRNPSLVQIKLLEP